MDMLVYVNTDGSYIVYLDGVKQIKTLVWFKVIEFAREHGESKFTVVDYQ